MGKQIFFGNVLLASCDGEDRLLLLKYKLNTENGVEPMLQKVIRKIAKKINPALAFSLDNYEILSSQLGQFRSMKSHSCLDAEENPIPWYTYAATEYIKQLDLSEKTIFEYGSGNSTLFWASRCKKIYSVEDDSVWYEKIKKDMPSDASYRLIEDREEYIHAIHSTSEKFDVVIVDGSYRYDCATQALLQLKDDGFIILDNSDWNEDASALLRQADLIEVDMSGFGPINNYTWTTSFYFRRAVSLVSAFDRQPVHGIGSLKHRNAH